MIRQAGTWLLTSLCLLGFVSAIMNGLKSSNSWIEFLLPLGYSIGFFSYYAFSARFPRSTIIAAIISGTLCLSYFIIQIIRYWQFFFIDNWEITLAVLYLPLFIAAWFGYRKLAEIRK